MDDKRRRSGVVSMDSLKANHADQLMAFHDGTTTCMHEGRAVCTLYLNFNKALDTTPHNVLIGKLRKCGLDKWTAGWMENWLNGT